MFLLQIKYKYYLVTTPVLILIFLRTGSVGIPGIFNYSISSKLNEIMLLPHYKLMLHQEMHQ